MTFINQYELHFAHTCIALFSRNLLLRIDYLSHDLNIMDFSIFKEIHILIYIYSISIYSIKFNTKNKNKFLCIKIFKIII